MLPLRRTLIALVLLSLVAAACSGGGDAETTTTTSTAATTTTAASTTTASTTTTTSTTTPEDTTTVTTYAPDYASPLNGLVATEDILLDRRAIAVKIDNHPQARPQSGLQSADAVIEILAEGVTRFMAIFHDNDTDYLGPIRSLRPTDSTLAAAIGAPIVISGGQDWIQNLTAGRHVPLIGENTTALFRVASRAAPHNLYGDTTAIRVVADQRGYSNDPPGVLFKIDTWKIPDEAATEISLDWAPGSVVVWTYNEATRTYLRETGGKKNSTVDRQGNLTQINADVLVVLTGDETVAYPPTGVSGSGVPETDTVGSGSAYVFARGRMWQGTWERSAIGDPFTLLNADGTEAVVPAGFPWISIFPAARTITTS
ncbi:MAG TPA: DUF3048 domain-containing protein [Acidimicrobiia bacterium]|nr:DUF3048 domain-containing protein [Acidimicrobiia bacterium]